MTIVGHDWVDHGMAPFGETEWICVRCRTHLLSLKLPMAEGPYVTVSAHSGSYPTGLPSDCGEYVIGKIMES